ncbi:MAG: PorV/PorQ family protein [Elusimicrobia bacterium]|nr:PorV/PorQ family protein [Elusimicrobiota bacterium]
MISPGARASGLGESFVSIADDFTVMYWNPAGMSFVERPEVGLANTSWVADITNTHIAFVKPLKRGGLGVAITSQQVEVIGYDTSGVRMAEEPTEEDASIGASASFLLGPKFSIGGTLKYVSVEIHELKAESATMDLGLMAKLGSRERFFLGGSFSNLSGSLEYDDAAGSSDDLPVCIRLGAGYKFLSDKNLTFAMALESFPGDDNAGGVRFGAEYWYKNFIALRLGAKSNSNDNTMGGSCFGFGLRYKGIGFDYAALSTGVNEDGMDSIQKINLSYAFGKAEKKEKPKKEPKKEKSKKEEPVKVKKPERKSGKINIAVADFAGKNVSQADASIVADFLRTDLVNTGVYTVIEKANMDKVLAEAAFQQTGCTTSECAVQIGKILNVKQMVVGSLSKLMDTYYITVNLVEVQTGKILASYDQEAMTAKQLKTACKTLAGKLANE